MAYNPTRSTNRVPAGSTNGECQFLTTAGERPLDVWAKLMVEIDPKPSDMEGAANYLSSKTAAQAMSGFDVYNSPFAPYSPGYAKRKRSSAVDLYGMGRHANHMLDLVTTQLSSNPPAILLGIFDDADAALRARVNNEGLSLQGRQARSYIKKLVPGKSWSRQRINAARKAATTGITVIPVRRFLGVTPQDVRIMSEMIRDSIVERLSGIVGG